MPGLLAYLSDVTTPADGKLARVFSRNASLSLLLEKEPVRRRLEIFKLRDLQSAFRLVPRARPAPKSGSAAGDEGSAPAAAGRTEPGTGKGAPTDSTGSSEELSSISSSGSGSSSSAPGSRANSPVPGAEGGAALLPAQGLSERERRKAEELKPMLQHTLETLKALVGPSWMNRHNPFLVQISRSNCAALGVPDYFRHVKKAMDLTTMDTKVASNCYTTTDLFAKDVCLIASNAKTFNRPGEPMHLFADRLLATFEQEMVSVVAEVARRKSERKAKRKAEKRAKKKEKKEKKEKKRERKKKRKRKAPEPGAGAAPGKRARHGAGPGAAGALGPRLGRALEALKALEGPSWMGQRNPFVVQITRENCASLGVPDYFRDVPRAMDLTTMGEKLAGGAYASADQFAKDARLIAKNAKTFNRPGEPMYLFADRLLATLDDEMAKI
jgi:hypothetical protein